MAQTAMRTEGPFTFRVTDRTGAAALPGERPMRADAIGRPVLPRWTMTTTATSGSAKDRRGSGKAPRRRLVVHAYSPGWLFDGTVALYEVVDGKAQPLWLTSDDFIYQARRLEKIQPAQSYPGGRAFA